MIFNLSVSSNRYVIGATGGIRTPDLPVRSRTLYPAKLLVQITNIIILNFLKIFNRKFKKNLQNAKIYDIIYKQFKLCLSNRGVAQLVARVVWDHEVAGSIPVTSTIFRRILRSSSFFAFMSKY